MVKFCWWYRFGIRRYFFLLAFTVLWMTPAFAGLPTKVYPWEHLDWPVDLQRWPHQLGPNFGQFQDLGSRYFHGGQDILSFPGAEIRTPVSGVLGGGFYSYKDLPSGHSEKRLVGLDDYLEGRGEPKWGKRFFEVSVTTPEGYRFEFHHVDPDSLPRNILQGILRADNVYAGEIVGHVIAFDHQAFGVDYDHIHYNVFSPENNPINPMQVSKKLKDTSAPRITLLGYGGKQSCRNHLGQFFKLHGPSTEFVPSNSGFLVVQVSDLIDGNIIAQAPTVFSVEFVGHSRVVYDFRHNLFDAEGHPYDIRKMFQEDMCVGLPEMAIPVPGSTFKQSFMKVKIPENFSGRAIIRASDFAGNFSSKTVIIMSTKPEGT